MMTEHPTEFADLGDTTDGIIGRFERQAAVRDRAIHESRLIVRLAANTVRAVHRREHDEVDRLSIEAKTRLEAMLAEVRAFPNLYWSGYVQDAVKEYAEARITGAIIGGQSIPAPDSLGAEDPAYLNALAEAASELRRTILDRLRHGDSDEAERLFAAMDEIYGYLITIDFADAITGGLRRAMDQLRGVLERTRGDLTLTTQQRRLERALRAASGTSPTTNEADAATE